MEGFINLQMINKKGFLEEISLNIKHIVYIRRYKTDNKVPYGKTAIFTQSKMIVVDDTYDKVNELIKATENNLLTV